VSPTALRNGFATVAQRFPTCNSTVDTGITACATSSISTRSGMRFNTSTLQRKAGWQRSFSRQCFSLKWIWVLIVASACTLHVASRCSCTQRRVIRDRSLVREQKQLMQKHWQPNDPQVLHSHLNFTCMQCNQMMV
jgi:hypothetical protein